MNCYKPDDITVYNSSPFGSEMPNRSFSSGEYRYGFNGQEKDLEINEGGNSMTAEFWQYNSRTGRRWNIDPRPNVSVSSYSAFSNNPIAYTDIKGDTSEFYNLSNGKFLGTINDEGDRRRIKIEEKQYNSSIAYFDQNGNVAGEGVENALVEFIIGAATLYEKFTDKNVISFETGDYALDFVGTVMPKNLITYPKKIGSSHADNGILGYMTLVSKFDDGSTLNIESYNITSGPYGNGPTPNNEYSVAYGEDGLLNGKPIWNGSTSESGMLLNSGDNGWKLRLPNFNGRSGLLIHPDCNSRGTAGCIGIRESDTKLIRLGNFLGDYITVQRRTLMINFNIHNNPNYGNNGNATNTGQ